MQSLDRDALNKCIAIFELLRQLLYSYGNQPSSTFHSECVQNVQRQLKEWTEALLPGIAATSLRKANLAPSQILSEHHLERNKALAAKLALELAVYIQVKMNQEKKTHEMNEEGMYPIQVFKEDDSAAGVPNLVNWFEGVLLMHQMMQCYIHDEDVPPVFLCEAWYSLASVLQRDSEHPLYVPLP